MHERVGVFVNKFSRPQAVDAAKKLGEQTHGTVEELDGRICLGGLDMVAVSGGDGSVRSVMQQMVKDNLRMPIVVIPGGSENGLWHSLVDAGATVTLPQLVSENRPEFPVFHPAAINTVLFHHAAGWDNFTVNEAMFNESFRMVFPRRLRGYLGGALSMFVSDIADEGSKRYTLRLATTGRFIGAIKLPMFRDMTLYSPDIGVLSIRAGSMVAAKAKVGLLAAHIFLGMQPPTEVAQIKKQHSLFIENYTNAKFVNADGEVVRLATSGTIYIRKTQDSIPVAALVTS